MKKCPYCSEEIQDEAIKCKYCNSNLHTEASGNNASVNAEQQTKGNKKKLKIVGWIVLGWIALSMWYISVPIIISILIIKKTKFSKEKRVAFAIAFFIIFVAIEGVIYHYVNRKPSIIISEPQNNSSIQSDKVILKGKIEPKGAELKIGNNTVDIKNGEFSYEVSLPREKNSIIIDAKNGYGKGNITWIVNRIFTDEERAQIEKQKAEAEAKKQADEKQAKKDKEAQDAKVLAEQKAWEKTKAGQICMKHPEWSREDCKNVAGRKIWVGMTYDMLVEVGGKPRSANPSNYGNGTSWQWCYSNTTGPNCFYDENDDGIIDSYN